MNDDDDDDDDKENNSKKQPMPIIQCSKGSLPPVMCLACLAYMSPYAEMDYKTGIWTCPLCEQENVAPKRELYEGSQIWTALKSNCVEYRQPPMTDEEEKGKRIKIKFGKEEDDYCTYLLVVDENLSQADGQAIAPAMESLLLEQENRRSDEKYPKTRIGLIVFGKSVATYQLSISGLASADVYVPSDVPTGKAEELENDMDKRAYLAEVKPGDSLESLRDALESVFGNEVEENETTDKSSENPSGFTSRMSLLSKRKDARNQKDNGDDEIPAVSPWLERRKKAKIGHQKRCTGEAIQCALDLASVDIPNPSRTTRVILFTNGCPNSGDGSVVAVESAGDKTKKNRRGIRPAHDVVDSVMLKKAVEYYDLSGNIAVSNGIGFEVFCCGVTELALPAYQALVEPSGGYVSPLLTFDTPQFEDNLRFLLENTYLSRSREIPEDMQDDEGGPECILDIRTDSFISPTQLCGSGEVLPDQASQMVENERPAFAKGAELAAEKGFKTNKFPSTEALELSMTRIQVGRVDPLSTFTVMLDIDDSMAEEDQYAFFQLVTRFVSRTGHEEITRVCTFRLPVAKDVSDFVGSVDDEAMSVVLGKAAVYRSLHGREETSDTRDKTAAGDTDSQEKLAYDAQLDIDATVQRISGAFRLLGLEAKMRSISMSAGPGRGNAESSLEGAFPPPLHGTLNRLYHLRRGPLISPGPMRSIDDRAESRGLFLRLPLEDCLQMMEPSVWSTGSIGGITSSWDVMQEFPAETLALWDNVSRFFCSSFFELCVHESADLIFCFSFHFLTCRVLLPQIFMIHFLYGLVQIVRQGDTTALETNSRRISWKDPRIDFRSQNCTRFLRTIQCLEGSQVVWHLHMLTLLKIKSSTFQRCLL